MDLCICGHRPLGPSGRVACLAVGGPQPSPCALTCASFLRWPEPCKCMLSSFVSLREDTCPQASRFKALDYEPLEVLPALLRSNLSPCPTLRTSPSENDPYWYTAGLLNFLCCNSICFLACAFRKSLSFFVVPCRCSKACVAGVQECYFASYRGARSVRQAGWILDKCRFLRGFQASCHMREAEIFSSEKP